MTTAQIAQALADLTDLIEQGQYAGALAPRVTQALGFLQAMHSGIIRLTPAEAQQAEAAPAPVAG
jgi:hypothetical protein